MVTVRNSQDWIQLLQKHLGKKFRKHFTELIHNIVAVDDSLKPAYLLDFGADQQRLFNLIEDLYKSGYITNPLNILSLDSDILIVNPKSLSQLQLTCSACVKLDAKYIFIDVSSKLEKPILTTSSDQRMECIEFIQSLPKCLDVVSKFNVDVSNTNLTTVFGLLLDFPFIYWFDNETSENCLSMETLKCFKVTRTISSSEKNSSKATESIRHKIFSFSIPDVLYDSDLESHLNKWFDERKELDTSLELSVKMETLPTVAL